VAAFWNGQASSLPSLDPSLPPSDPDRWSSSPSSPSKSSSTTVIDHQLGSPSDHAYIDALYSLLEAKEAGARAEWDATLEDAFENDGFEKGETAPRGKEGLSAVSMWRVLRRMNGKILRREALGY